MTQRRGAGEDADPGPWRGWSEATSGVSPSPPWLAASPAALAYLPAISARQNATSPFSVDLRKNIGLWEKPE